MLEKYSCSTPWLISRFVRRREVGEPREPAVPRVTDLSPYSPLPAIGSRQNSGLEAVSETPPSTAEKSNSSNQFPPPLRRQDTYVVCNPLVVKGPKPRRKFKRGEAWGGRKDSQTPKQTSGGTFFTISVDSSGETFEPIPNNSDQDVWLKENNSNNFQHITQTGQTDDNSVRNENAQAYWLEC